MMFGSPLLSGLSSFAPGQSGDSIGASVSEVINPSTGVSLARLSMQSDLQVLQAIDLAKEGLRITRTTRRRGMMLARIAALLDEHRRELARIICVENGKPWREAEGEVDYASGFFRYYSEQMNRLKSRRLRAQPRSHQWTIHYRPSGVAGLIVPWNFPLAMLAKKLSAAIAAGAPCVIKPAPQTPLSTLALLPLLSSAKVPKEWAQVVIGDPGMIGRIFCEHPDVRTISFTGSTRVGKILLRQTTETVKRLTLELGGNAPLLVCADADVELAVEHLMQNKFRCAGQTCVCVNRVYVHESLQATLVQSLVQRASMLKVGDGMRDDVHLGPLINRQGFDKVAAHLSDALERGAQLQSGGMPHVTPGQSFGFYFPPTILSDVPQDALCVREETFGPMIPIVPFSTMEQAIEWSNASEFGLAAYVFTASISAADRLIRELQFGHVGLNSATGPTPEAPFGGMKQSGIGREGGIEGLMEFVETQVVARDLHNDMS